MRSGKDLPPPPWHGSIRYRVWRGEFPLVGAAVATLCPFLLPPIRRHRSVIRNCVSLSSALSRSRGEFLRTSFPLSLSLCRCSPSFSLGFASTSPSYCPSTYVSFPLPLFAVDIAAHLFSLSLYLSCSPSRYIFFLSLSRARFSSRDETMIA